MRPPIMILRAIKRRTISSSLRVRSSSGGWQVVKAEKDVARLREALNTQARELANLENLAMRAHEQAVPPNFFFFFITLKPSGD